MNPIVDPKAFEQHGDGFGNSDAQTVAELNKALTAGTAVTPGTQSNGGALRVESLDSTLKIVSFLEKNIIFYNDIPKTKAYNTVEEYNILSKYGGKGGFFIEEGGLPRSEDSSYQRKAAFVKFMGTTREISHPMLLVRPAHGSVVALETKNGAKWMLQRMEEALFAGASGVISQSFDGLERQLLDGYVDPTTAGDGRPDVSLEHVIDLRGQILSEAVFEEVARILQDNYYYPTHCYLNNSNHTDFNKAFFSKGRFQLPVGADSTVGFVVDRVRTSGGVVQLRPDVFLRVDQSAPALADNAAAPTAPVSATVTVQATSTSRGFKAAEYGTYTYEVTALSKSGESAPTAGNVSAVVAAPGSSEVRIVIARGAVAGNDLTQGYRVYRTRLGDTSGRKYLVAEIASAGASTTYLDGNEFLPGLGRAYMGQLDESVMSLRELSPMLKFPLATVASSIRWMQLYYCVPITFRPRGWVVIKNIGRLDQPKLGAV